jgi:hypothetical protein
MDKIANGYKEGFLKYLPDLNRRIVYLDSSVVYLPSFALTSLNSRYSKEVVHRCFEDVKGQINVLNKLKSNGTLYVDRTQGRRFDNGTSKMSETIDDYLSKCTIAKTDRQTLVDMRDSLKTLLSQLPTIRPYSKSLPQLNRIYDDAKNSMPQSIFGLPQIDPLRVEFYLDTVAQNQILSNGNSEFRPSTNGAVLLERMPIIFSLEKSLEVLSKSHNTLFPSLNVQRRVNILSPDYCVKGVPYQYSLK